MCATDTTVTRSRSPGRNSAPWGPDSGPNVHHENHLDVN
jgi:hypothetical protein